MHNRAGPTQSGPACVSHTALPPDVGARGAQLTSTYARGQNGTVGEVFLVKKQPLLEQMRRNPRADWSIDDVAKLCAEHHIDLMSPTRGDHFKAASPLIPGHLTIPAKRPIKPVYIRMLVGMIDRHEELCKEGSK